MSNNFEERIKSLENRVSALEKIQAASQSFPKESRRKKLGVSEFLNDKKPKTDVERVLVLAVYHDHFTETDFFSLKDISNLIKKAKLKKPSNTSDAINRNVKKGLFEEDDEKGEDGKKRWYVTETGSALVDNNFERE